MTDVNINIMLPAQCRAARGLLGIDQADLATSSGVSRNTVADFEAGRRAPRGRSITAMQEALEAAGVMFIPQNGDGPGVRIRFEWAIAHTRENGTQCVLTRWQKGDPLEVVEIEHALAAAEEAERRGQRELAVSLRTAAQIALKQEDPRLGEAIQRYSRSRAALAARSLGGPMSAAEEELASHERRYMEGVAAEIASLRDRG